MRMTITLIAWLALAGVAYAQRTPIEQGAYITPARGLTERQLLGAVDPAVGLVRAYGYRCDTVSAFRPLMTAGGFMLRCNRFRYEYDIRDVGGRMVVRVNR